MLLNDPDHKEWTELDFKLAKAYELRKTYGDIPPWIDRSERVSFDAKSFISKSAAAVERAQHRDQVNSSKQGNSPKFGKRYYAVPRTVDEGPMPTMQEWLEDQRRLNGET